MSKIKALWQYLLIRYLAYQILVLGFVWTAADVADTYRYDHSLLILILWLILLFPLLWFVVSLKRYKNLWRYPTFRWLVYQILFLILLAFFIANSREFDLSQSEAESVSLFLFPTPMLWVWRKPIKKLVNSVILSRIKIAVIYLNKKAEED